MHHRHLLSQAKGRDPLLHNGGTVQLLERKPRFLYTPPPLQSRPWPNEQWAQPAIGNPNVGIQPINDHVSLGTAARHQLARVIVGQEELIDQLMVGLISNGHILLEGLAKNARAQDARLRIGLLLPLTAGRVLAKILYQVSPIDPLALFSASLMLATAALLACFFPASRATGVNPMRRCEPNSKTNFKQAWLPSLASDGAA